MTNLSTYDSLWDHAMINVQIEFKTKMAVNKPALTLGTLTDADQHSFELTEGITTISRNLRSDADDVLTICYWNRDDSDTIMEDGVVAGHSVIEITELLIDRIDVCDFIYKIGTQYPKYRQSFLDMCDIKPPDFLRPGTVFNHNGIFEFPFKLPYWRHMLDLIDSGEYYESI